MLRVYASATSALQGADCPGVNVTDFDKVDFAAAEPCYGHMYTARWLAPTREETPSVEATDARLAALVAERAEPLELNEEPLPPSEAVPAATDAELSAAMALRDALEPTIELAPIQRVSRQVKRVFDTTKPVPEPAPAEPVRDQPPKAGALARLRAWMSLRRFTGM